MDIHGNRFTDAGQARQFILAGNARVTLKSTQTGKHFTYRVRKAKDDDVFFVGVLKDGDNENGYAPLGIITKKREFKILRRCSFREYSPCWAAFDWMWTRLQANKISDAMEFWHEGRCGRCGRALTDPDSIESGFGPECIKIV